MAKTVHEFYENIGKETLEEALSDVIHEQVMKANGAVPDVAVWFDDESGDMKMESEDLMKLIPDERLPITDSIFRSIKVVQNVPVYIETASKAMGEKRDPRKGLVFRLELKTDPQKLKTDRRKSGKVFIDKKGNWIASFIPS